MRSNILPKLLACFAILTGSSLSAQASSYNLGPLQSGAPTSFNAIAGQPGQFSDIFSFSLGSGSSVGVSVINFPVTGLFNTVLTSASLFSNFDGTAFNGDDSLITSYTASSNGISFTSGPVGAGSYYLNVTGIANGSLGGLYNGAISIAPVPEPETYVMLLAGIGVMGFIAVRRNKAQT
jgi:PEP-CTERM motif